MGYFLLIYFPILQGAKLIKKSDKKNLYSLFLLIDIEMFFYAVGKVGTDQ